MNVLVIYNSRDGHTQDLANRIAQTVHAQNHDVDVKSVIEVQQQAIELADMLFVGTWVHGFILFGVKPAGADLWVPSLPSLDDKPVAIFCTYAFNPRKSLQTLGEMLENQGAMIVNQHAFHRNRITDGVESFVQKALQSVAYR